MTDIEKLVEQAMDEWNPEWRVSPRDTKVHQWRAMRKVVELILASVEKKGTLL